MDDVLKEAVILPKPICDLICAQSKPYQKTLELIAHLKVQHGLRIVVISYELREFNAHRIRALRLDLLVNAFVSSCYVGLRKPDVEIVRRAFKLAQTTPGRSVFIENTPMFVQVAERLGMNSIFHVDHESTRAALT